MMGDAIGGRHQLACYRADLSDSEASPRLSCQCLGDIDDHVGLQPRVDSGTNEALPRDR